MTKEEINEWQFTPGTKIKVVVLQEEGGGYYVGNFLKYGRDNIILSNATFHASNGTTESYGSTISINKRIYRHAHVVK